MMRKSPSVRIYNGEIGDLYLSRDLVRWDTLGARTELWWKITHREAEEKLGTVLRNAAFWEGQKLPAGPSGSDTLEEKGKTLGSREGKVS
jgi:hypothetical protein